MLRVILLSTRNKMIKATFVLISELALKGHVLRFQRYRTRNGCGWLR